LISSKRAFFILSIDVSLEDEDQALLQVHSLPSSYENLCDTLVYGKESLTLDLILFLKANVSC